MGPLEAPGSDIDINTTFHDIDHAQAAWAPLSMPGVHETFGKGCCSAFSAGTVVINCSRGSPQDTGIHENPGRKEFHAERCGAAMKPHDGQDMAT